VRTVALLEISAALECTIDNAWLAQRNSIAMGRGQLTEEGNREI
jgi:hypothetical protein